MSTLHPTIKDEPHHLQWRSWAGGPADRAGKGKLARETSAIQGSPLLPSFQDRRCTSISAYACSAAPDHRIRVPLLALHDATHARGSNWRRYYSTPWSTRGTIFNPLCHCHLLFSPFPSVPSRQQIQDPSQSPLVLSVEIPSGQAALLQASRASFHRSGLRLYPCK